jgi:ferritin-like metal-binding protein YciE
MIRLGKFDDLLVRELKELHHSEGQQLAELPRLSEAAEAPSLRDALAGHAAVVSRQSRRLDEALGLLRRSSRGRRCKPVHDLLRDASSLVAGPGKGTVKDAGLIVVLQKIHHHEICGYGSARTIAQILGHDDIAELLHLSMLEEAAADRRLGDIAVDLYTATDRGGDEAACKLEPAFQP